MSLYDPNTILGALICGPITKGKHLKTHTYFVSFDKQVVVRIKHASSGRMRIEAVLSYKHLNPVLVAPILAKLELQMIDILKI